MFPCWEFKELFCWNFEVYFKCNFKKKRYPRLVFVETCRAFFCPGLVQLWWAICSDNAIYLIPIISTLTITINVDIAKGTKKNWEKSNVIYSIPLFNITVKTTSSSLCFVFVYIIHIWAKNASSPKVCFVYLCIYVSYSSLCIFPSSGLHAGRGVCLCVHHLSQQGLSFNWVTKSQFLILNIPNPSQGFVL